jgi:hypothetical protein
LYKNKTDTKTQVLNKPWEAWIKVFSTHAVRGKPSDRYDEDKLNLNKDGPAVILGKLSGTRCKKNVISVTAEALDLDDINTTQLREIFDILAPYEWVAYTTHKNGGVTKVGRPRVRIILPLKDPILPSKHTAFWHALNRLIGGHNDPSTKDVSRLHFLPSTFDLKFAAVQHNRGRWISIEDLPTVPDAVFEAVEKTEQVTKLQSLLNSPSKKHPLKESFRALLKGAPFAPKGERHDTLLKITMWIAQRRAYLSRSTLDDLFTLSIGQMPGLSLDEVWTAYEGACGKISQSVRAKQLNGQLPYTSEQLQQIAKTQGWTPDQLEHRWIIQIDGGGWVLDGSGQYRGMFSRNDLQQAIWSMLRPAPVRLVDPSPTGYKHRTAVEMVRDYGTLAQKVISDMSATSSVFSVDTDTMRESVCPIRNELKPTYDKRLDEWLQVFGGDFYNKLVDWLSVVPKLDLLLCALYINGEKGIGKSMLAHGLARIWTEGAPTKLSQILGEFNEALVDCPLILADEKLPKKSKWDSITEDLREMVSTNSRELTRKYKAPSKLIGCIRLILAANNEFLLESAQTYSRADQEAIAQRFLYLKIGNRPAEFLNEVPRDVRKHWWDRGIAEHTLWLHENHVVKTPGVRFEVEGDESVMHRLLMTGSYWNSMVCEWLVRYLNDPKPFDVQNKGLVRCIDGDLLVNEQAVIDGWELYLGKTRVIPETAKIGAALRALAKNSERKQLRWLGIRIRYRYIDIKHLFDWSERFNIGDRDKMVQTLNPSPNLIDLNEKNTNKIKKSLDY